MTFWRFSVGAVILVFSFTHSFTAHAALLPDTDNDGLLDVWETQIFHTNPAKADSDADGFPDGTEIRYGFDPLSAKSGARVKTTDTDTDGLSDAQEVAFGSDPLTADSDGDTYSDGTEVANAYQPTSPEPTPMVKTILVDLSDQKLYQKLDGVIVGTFPVSSGKASTPTPVGTYTIQNKSPRAWSSMASLWMPYWMAFKGPYGIHELPEWPGGKKEGKAHLGTPVSHGCVRLGEGVAKALYEWTPIGTSVTIQR